MIERKNNQLENELIQHIYLMNNDNEKKEA
jgi:hypothetical protein